jgi:hypothetical protein
MIRQLKHAASAVLRSPPEIFMSTTRVAPDEKITRPGRSRFLKEAAKLDSEEEQALAEEGMAGDAAEWPQYERVAQE